MLGAWVCAALIRSQDVQLLLAYHNNCAQPPLLLCPMLPIHSSLPDATFCIHRHSHLLSRKASQGVTNLRGATKGRRQPASQPRIVSAVTSSCLHPNMQACCWRGAELRHTPVITPHRNQRPQILTFIRSVASPWLNSHQQNISSPGCRPLLLGDLSSPWRPCEPMMPGSR